MRSKSHLESRYIFQILFMLSEQMDSRPTMSNSSSSSSLLLIQPPPPDPT